MEVQSVRDWPRAVKKVTGMLWLLAIAAVADVQAAENSLVLGVFPRYNATQTTTMYTPLAEQLSQQLGNTTVQLVTSKDFDSFWKEVQEQKYDIVHYNQYHYIRSAQNYQVIAHIEELGKSTIAGAIYVRKDSGIASLAQLRGKTVLFGGGEDAMISYITNRYLMLQAGLKKEDYKSLFAVNPPNSILALYSRLADAAGAGDGVLDLPVVKKYVNTDELIALDVSAPLLQLPVAVT